MFILGQRFWFRTFHSTSGSWQPCGHCNRDVCFGNLGLSVATQRSGSCGFSLFSVGVELCVDKDVRLSYTGICNARFEGYCEASLQVNRYKQIVQRSARSAALLGCTLCEEMKFVKVFSKLWLSC